MDTKHARATPAGVARGQGATLRQQPLPPRPAMQVILSYDAEGVDPRRHERWHVYIVEDGAVLWHQRNGTWSRDLGGRAIVNGYDAAVLTTNYAGWAVPA